MPQQLIYTSAPRGIVAGRSGYCTVARSATLREALMLQLEKFCYYQHLSLSGGQERPICACRVVDIRGSRFHVLTRIQDAGLDFTGRTNFIAHHLVFAPDELRKFPAPPVILRDWPGWRTAWNQDPQLLENEDWTQLAALAGRRSIPAQAWPKVTGDAANGYGLLEKRAGSSFRVDDQSNETVLELFAESLALLEIRDPRRDFLVAAWNYTFTTSIQEQDNPADFRWRCIHSDNPAASRFATPDCCPLSAVRALKCTNEEADFARTGPKPPKITSEPQDLKITEGEVARFIVQAEGIPSPKYQWFSVDQTGKGEVLAGETNSELVLANPAFGTTRYVARASNGMGDVQSRVAKLSSEERSKAPQLRLASGPRPGKSADYQRSEEEIESHRQRLAAKKSAEEGERRERRNKILVTTLAILLIAVASVAIWIKHRNRTASGKSNVVQTGEPSNNSPATITLTTQSNASGELNRVSEQQNFPLSDGSLPAGWKSHYIGSTSEVRSVKYDQGKFVLTGQTGRLRPKETSDEFVFASRTFTNAVEFSAQLSVSETNENSCRGIMLRESYKANSAFILLGVSGAKFLCLSRTASGVPSQTNYASTESQGEYLKLTREGDNFSGSHLVSGTNWVSLVTIEFKTPNSNYLAGLAVCCDSTNKAVTATFEGVTIDGVKQ